MKQVFTMTFLFLVISTSVVSAQNNRISLHGFGGWAYGRTDNENRYLAGNEDGNYDSVNFALNITANPAERLTLHVQAAYDETKYDEDVGLDYAFAEWYWSEHLQLRAGKVKAPFMLYTEIYDVGTLRPFFSLPQGVYQELAAEGYKGIGLSGSFELPGEWELLYDLYGGQMKLLPNLLPNAETLQFDAYAPVLRDMFGGRLTLLPPYTGLTLSCSVYTGEATFTVNDQIPLYDPFEDRYTLVGLSIEYLSDTWWLRSEYLMQKDSPNIEADVWYLEAAYRLFDRWQAAARYEHATYDVADAISTAAESMIEHEEVALGINYWFNPNFVMKVSYHLVNGNRFAFPEQFEDYMQNLMLGDFEEETHLFLAGMQFSF